MAEWFVLLTSDHKDLGWTPAGGRIQFMTTSFHCIELFMINRPSSQYDYKTKMLKGGKNTKSSIISKLFANVFV